MSYGSRQSRLRGLVGGIYQENRPKLCFQVCVGVYTPKDFTSREEFNAAVTEYGGVKDNFESNIDNPLEAIFNLSSYDQVASKPASSLTKSQFFFPSVRNRNGKRVYRGVFVTAEIILTIYPYNIDHKYVDAASPVERLRDIAKLYIPKIQAQDPDYEAEIMPLPALRKEGGNGEILSQIKFKYLVRPYEPDLCHREKIGQAQPITVIGPNKVMP